MSQDAILMVKRKVRGKKSNMIGGNLLREKRK